MTSGLDHDPAVPQRDLLLQPALVAERLAPLLGSRRSLAIESCRQVRVKYRVGARLRVVHRVRARAARFDISASTFPSLDRSERAYADARAQAVASGVVPPVLHDRGLATVFWTFPNDRKIAGLAALAVTSPELARMHPEWRRSELVSYAPEKSATMRCRDDAGRTIGFAKVYAGEEAARALRVHDVLTQALGQDDPHLRLPRALGYSQPHHTLLVQWVDATPLYAPDAADAEMRYVRLGRALARFHELPSPDATRFTRSDLDRLEAAAELIGVARRDTAGAARCVAREVVPRLDAGDLACLHGDVNFRNALLENGRVALIDLDQVATGPPAAELGSVLASLRYGAIVGVIQASVAPRLARSLLEGYAEVRPLPEESTLRAYTSAALLGERALRVVTRVRTEGLRRLPALLTDAREVLG